MSENWTNLGNALNDSFFFVLDKLVSLESYFIDVSYAVARVVLLIALLSAGLNYALTGAGLKDNLIKIMKATVFFLIIAFAYPRVISWITKVTFDVAYGSVGPSVEAYFHGKVMKMEKIVSDISASGTTYHPLIADYYTETKNLQAIFSKMKTSKEIDIGEKGKIKGKVTYTSVVPAAAIEVMLLVSSDAFNSADNAPKNNMGLPDFAVLFKGLICGFFIIFTGVFALLEYLMCMIEFMLVSSVGVILLPTSIWEGSKFIAEGFIKAVVGFFLKLILCTLSIYLLLWGFISILHSLMAQGFRGSPDQLAFIIFTCLLFFYICKSAPGVAQTLVTGSPSLSASGAISAAGGAVAAAAGVAGAVGKTGAAAKSFVGGGINTVNNVAGALTEAKAAKDQAAANGKGKAAQNGIAALSMLRSGGLGLARSISGNKNIGKDSAERKQQGQDFADKFK